MIKLAKTIDIGPMELTRASIRKLAVDAKDKQVSFTVGFGNDETEFCEAAPVRRFHIRKDVLSGDGIKVTLPEGFYGSLVSGVGGAIIDVLEKRLIASELINGEHQT